MSDLKSYIREIPNWPKKGVNFKDITPLLIDSKAFRKTINEMAKPFLKRKIDLIVGIDARGFILASALAYKLKTGLTIIRKEGKLPHKTIKKKYTLEYGSNTIEMHKDSIKPKQNILIVDDVLATGGTMKASVDIVNKLEGNIIGISFLAILNFLNGERKLKNQKIYSLIRYDK